MRLDMMRSIIADTGKILQVIDQARAHLSLVDQGLTGQITLLRERTTWLISEVDQLYHLYREAKL